MREKSLRLSRVSLNALHNTIFVLENHEPVSLNDVLVKWRLEVKERLNYANIGFKWLRPNKLNKITIPARLKICAEHILTEAITNAIKYGDPAVICIAFEISSLTFVMEIRDNGGCKDLEWTSGLGVKIMRDRVNKLNGKIERLKNLESSTSGVIVRCELPLETG